MISQHSSHAISIDVTARVPDDFECSKGRDQHGRIASHVDKAIATEITEARLCELGDQEAIWVTKKSPSSN